MGIIHVQYCIHITSILPAHFLLNNEFWNGLLFVLANDGYLEKALRNLLIFPVATTGIRFEQQWVISFSTSLMAGNP